MRVIGGEYRSRPLRAPAGETTRPTSDRLRETLFNVLQSRIRGARFADLYAGTGAVGIEALSRGAEFVAFAENAREPLTALRHNLKSLGISRGFAVDDRSVARALSEWRRAGRVFDLVFADPPWEHAKEYSDTLGAFGGEALEVLAPDALLIIEHRCKTPLPECAGAHLRRTRVLTQGDAALSFYARAQPSAEPPEASEQAAVEQ